jgi:uncharacterized protein YwqG
MTPYSERLDAAKKELRKQIENFGLSRVTDDMEKFTMVSIRIKTKSVSEDELQLGCSKMGGTPDLPEGMAWPDCNGTLMAFMAQFYLPDIAPYNPDEQLPKTGMLYFFYEAKEQKWGYDPKDRGNWKAIYYNGESNNLHSIPIPENLPKESRFQSCALTFTNEITIPSWLTSEREQLNLSEKEKDGYIDLLESICNEGETIHRLSGHPNQIQNDMKLECQLASNGLYVGNDSGYKDPRRKTLEKGASDWRLLFQIDTDEKELGTIWGDVGRIYFWIRQQELEERDFSNVWLVLQCY